MIKLRTSAERGKSQINWLTSFHTFSFADYYDPAFMGISHLRVINEDTVQPGCGFAKHPHQDMDIISYVIEGALEHKDSMGTGSIIKPGEIQRMSAGTGVTHSEFNSSKTELVHFLQIWIIPQQNGLTPSYEQKSIPKSKDQWILIGSQEGGADAITIHQNVKLYVAYLSGTHTLFYDFNKGRRGWLQMIRGALSINGQPVFAGDGASITDEKQIELLASEDAEFLFFDLE